MNKRSLLLWVLMIASVCSQAQENFPEISLEIPTVAAQPGETICLDVIAPSFDHILAVSFTVVFDPAVLQFESIRNINLPGATLEKDFNLEIVEQGKVGLVWFDISARTLSKPFVLFTLCLKAVGPEGTVSRVGFGNDPVPLDIIGNEGPFTEEIFRGRLKDGAVFIREGGQLPAVPAIAGESTLFSCGDEWRNSIQVSVSGGLPPYQYIWKGPGGFQSDVEDPAFLPFGVYFLTVTDQNQNPAFATFNLPRPQALGAPEPLIKTVDVTPSGSCLQPDGAIRLNLQGDSTRYIFAWSNGATSQNLSGLPAGEYGVSVSDDNGCMTQWSGRVENTSNLPVRLVNQPAVCTVRKGSITIDNARPDQFAYVWSTGDTTTTITGLNPGNYTLTVTDALSGCSAVYASTVSATGAIPFQIETLQPGCDGSLGSIAVNVQIGLDLQIRWATGDTTFFIDQLEEGNYPFILTDGIGGCRTSPTVPLRKTDLTIELTGNCLDQPNGPDSLLVSAFISGGSGPYTIHWSNGQVQAGVSSGQVKAAAPALLYASVSDQEGCTVYPQAPFVCQDGGQPNPFDAGLFYECSNEQGLPAFSAYIWSGGTAPYSFAWSNGFSETDDRFSTALIDEDGFPAVTITDAEGRVQILYGHPLLPGACGDPAGALQLSMPDTLVEVDEPFAIPILVNAAFPIHTLRVEIQWDSALVSLDSIATAGFAGKVNVEYQLENKLGLNFAFPGFPDLSFGEGTIAWLQFSPRGVESAAGPVVFSYQRLQAAGIYKNHPVQTRNALITILSDGEKVWPGDTDRSKTVDHYDLLNIGLAYGAGGPVRPGASLNWQAQYCPPWEPQTPASNLNYRHIDTNGDGLIDANDTLAIALHWEQVAQHLTDPRPKADGPLLSVEVDAISSDERRLFPIVLGTAAEPAENIYGLAFSIYYEGFVSTLSPSLDFSHSWLDDDGTPLLTVFRNFPDRRRIDIALVRTDGQNISGSGLIAELALQGNNRTGAAGLGKLDIQAVRLINALEQTLPVVYGPIEVQVDFSTGMNEPVWARQISLAPVPAREEIWIKAEGVAIETLQIMDASGKTMGAYPFQNRLAVGHLPAGLYYLRIRTAAGVAVKKWMKE